MNSRQVSARSKAGRRAERSWAAVGQAGQTRTAAPRYPATRYRRRRARRPAPSGEDGAVITEWRAAGGAGIESPEKSYTELMLSPQASSRRDRLAVATVAQSDPGAGGRFTAGMGELSANRCPRIGVTPPLRGDL